jgi:8-amino-7-oxononanoate synthase
MSHEKIYAKFLQENTYPRTLRNFEFAEYTDSSVYLQAGQQRLINFSSNDYLGLSRHPLLIARSQEYAARWGVGSTSSRLVSGNLTIFTDIEAQLAKALGKPAALILGSGYQTNIAILEALLDKAILGATPLVFCDRYAHVSMLAMTQHLCRLQRFRHNDLVHLRSLLEKYADNRQPKFILVESLYSMDGDCSQLDELVVLAKQHQAFLYVDDAHAVGAYGENGFGRAVKHADDIDIVMGTFSKGLGSFGGYIGCSQLLRDYLVNKCRGLIYATGLSPAVLGAISAAIELLPQLDKERQRLHANAKIIREFFASLDLDCGNSDSHIIPWMIGDADEALEVSRLLETKGILASTIRPPSVPVGKSRIRFCLSAAHTDEDIEKLMAAIRTIKNGE